MSTFAIYNYLKPNSYKNFYGFIRVEPHCTPEISREVNHSHTQYDTNLLCSESISTGKITQQDLEITTFEWIPGRRTYITDLKILRNAEKAINAND